VVSQCTFSFILHEKGLLFICPCLNVRELCLKIIAFSFSTL
jgi:hypothetical protein